jgi:hypothetical protein
MLHAKIVRSVLLDVASGDRHSLMGLIDWLVHDCNYPLDRVVAVAQRIWGIPAEVTILTIGDL